MPKIPSYTGTDSVSPDRPEIEHFGNCDVCGALVDMRDLAQVMAHMHGQGATRLERQTRSRPAIDRVRNQAN